MSRSHDRDQSSSDGEDNSPPLNVPRRTIRLPSSESESENEETAVSSRNDNSSSENLTRTVPAASDPPDPIMNQNEQRPSTSSSMGGNQNVPGTSGGSEFFYRAMARFSNSVNQLQASTSNASSNVPAPGGSNSTEAQNGSAEIVSRPVGGFRTSYGPDGEEIVEFVSDEEESNTGNAEQIFDDSYEVNVEASSSEDEDDENHESYERRIGEEPMDMFDFPSVDVSHLHLHLRTAPMGVGEPVANNPQGSGIGNGPIVAIGRRAPNDDSSSSDEDDDEDPDWFARVGVEPSVPFNVPNRVVQGIAGRVLNQQRGRRRLPASSGRRLGAAAPETSTSSSNRNRRPPGTRKRRKGKGKAAKKKSPQKPKAPPKPLGPLTIFENWDGNDDHKQYLKVISKSLQSRVHINVQETIEEGQEKENKISEPSTSAKLSKSQTDKTAGNESGAEIETEEVLTAEESNAGYLISELKFDRCSTHAWKWKDKEELSKAFPGLECLNLHVSSSPGASIIHLKTTKTLKGDDVSLRKGPPPKLTKRDSERELIYVVTQHYFFHVDPVDVPAEFLNIRGLGNRKMFAINFKRFDMDEQRFYCDLILLHSSIMGDHSIDEIPVPKHSLMKEIFTNFLGVLQPPDPLNDEARKKEDIEWFYGQIKKYHLQESLPPADIPLQPSSLKPTLRQYQREAVHWMLYREGCLDQSATSPSTSSSSYQTRMDLSKAFLKKMYVPVKLTKYQGEAKDVEPETCVAYYSLNTGYLCWTKPAIPPLPSGGILCDEMGLGKTVETLCLILLNQKKVPEELQEYFGNDTDSKVVDEEAVEDEDVKKSSSASESEEDSDDDDYSVKTSDSEESRPRKRGRISKTKTPRSNPPRASRSTRSSTTPRYQNSKRRRALSPCEFTAAAGDVKVENVSPEEASEQPGPSRRRRSTNSTQITALAFVDKQIETIKRDRRNGKNDSGNQKRPALFEAMKVLYDTALSEYRFADYARSAPKFHGKFYEVELEQRELFECVCGEYADGCRDWEIIKCASCCSSQHANCVGFDMSLVNLYKKLGRQYLCPHCESLNPPFETKSTLIITPPSISHQWIKEIQKHVQNHRLNILFYKGVGVHGYMPPAKLARYDIVITTYSVLSSELDYVDLPHCNSADGRRFRNAKRFLTIPSPLPCVLWWRVCLDEAQMVEGISTKMSMMAMRFKAIHRWCVTGTPMNKGLEDLFGLFVFLQVSPINYDIWWGCLVRDAFLRKDTDLLYELFGQTIWRNGKQDVLDQLGIPPQTEMVHWLNFSPVETHFYKQQFETCANKIREKIARLRRSNPDVDILCARLSTLDRASLNGLLAPFLELRQACCHPQIVKGQVISLQKGPLTMEDLLERLIRRNQLKCIDSHRLAISSLNGLAGLHIIKKEYVAAAAKYREVLQSVEKYKEHFKSDPLQLLHAIENLAELLDENHQGIPYTLRDDSLRTEAAELRTNYMKKYADSVRAASEVVNTATNSVDEIAEQFTMHKESWWYAALKAATRIQKSDGLIQTLKQDLLDVSKKNFQKTLSLANKFSDSYGLQRILIPILVDMERLRETVLENVEELQSNDPSTYVESAVQCHLRKKSYGEESDEKCKLCEHHDNFLRYENLIFKIEAKDKISRTGRNYQKNKLIGELEELELTEATTEELLQQEADDLKATTEHVQLMNSELRRGHWGDSETEVILKGILRFARAQSLSSEICENGQVHMKLFEALKKEFRLLRILWRQIYDQVSAVDELSQATTRLQLVDRWLKVAEKKEEARSVKQLKSGLLEKSLRIQSINIVSAHDIDERYTQTVIEHSGAQEALSIQVGQLIYLKSLKKNGYGKKGTTNTDDCPVCSIQLGKEWNVLLCGHSFCSDCIKNMLGPNQSAPFLCPLCRITMSYADVSFVDTNKSDAAILPGTSKTAREIMGSHSSKVESIVETVLDLEVRHPGEKCIIFSMWVEVLEIIAKALDQNRIKYSLLTQSGRQFHQNLDRFKEREDIQVLLMPLSSGAKGLNIIEATHVLLVEPILNIASELQAIGRVHRIGQTKPTFVHRFYIKRTIEEKLFQILKGQDISSDEEGSLTVKDLENLVSTTSNASSSNEPKQ